MRIVLCWLVYIIIPVSIFGAQPWPVDSTKIEGAAQDSTGQVWAFGHHPNLGLYRWEGDKWNPVKVTGVNDKAWPWTLALGPDGAVYALWSDAAGLLAVSRHHETASKLLVQFKARLRDRPRIFVDPGGNVWITEQGRHIYCVTPQGKAECVYTISDEQFHENGRPKSENWTFNPIYATADGRGRVWFWSDSLAGRIGWASLQGVLVFDGAKFEHHASIAGIPDKKFSVIEPEDAEHMWLAALSDQLYRIDINALTGTPAARPASPAFRFVHKIFRVARETYLISGSAQQPVPERSGGGRFGVLWQGIDGTWKRLVNGLDMQPESFQQVSRPFLASDQELWVGGFGNGPWLIQQGAETLVDWHYGYPLDGSEGLFRLADGPLLMISRNQGSITVNPTDLAFQTPSSDVSTLNPPHMLSQDARGHIWGILGSADKALDEWDGRRWTEYPIPLLSPAQQVLNSMVDSLGRIWLLVQSSEVFPDPSVAIIWNTPNDFGPGTTREGVNFLGTGFGTNPVVEYSAPGMSCRETYASDTQITCTVTVLPDCPGGRYSFTIWSNGYNGAPYNNGMRGIGIRIFDPKQQSFQYFPTYEQALQAQLPLRKDLHVPAPPCCMSCPSFAPDGRVCYYASRDRIRYFDSTHWREWSIKEILGPKATAFDGALFFDRAGNLAVNLQSKTREFTAGKGWQVIAPEPGPDADSELKRPQFNPAPSGCAVKQPESLVQDRLGTLWFTSQGQLYRAVGGWCSPQFAPDEHQPFIDSRKLLNALIDPQGNTFLPTLFRPDFAEYVILKTRSSLPRTVLRASVDSWGNVTLRFATKGQAARGFTWRIDGGPWSTPTQSTEATVDYLSNGTHRVEASAVDERLQIDLTPAVATVEIHIEDATVRALIQKLADPDYSVREKALAALLRRPALALPLLQSAREKAGPDHRWWIDAAIQQIEESLATHRRP